MVCYCGRGVGESHESIRCNMKISFDLQLPSAVKKLSDVLSFGRTYGQTWIVSHFGGGYLAGYLRVIEGHPWFRSYDIERDCMQGCHTGIKWCGSDLRQYQDVAEGWWFGFNCATYYDYPDETLAKEYGCDVENWKPKQDGQTVRRLDYVEDILISLSQEAWAAIMAEENKQRKRRKK